MMTWLLTPITTPSHSLMFGLGALVVAAVAQTFSPDIPYQLVRDSFEYLEFHPHRRALYPAFLDLFGDDTLYNYQHTLDRIALTQIIIFLLALGAMMAALAHARLPISVLIVFLVALTSNYQLHTFHHILFPESLSLSLTYLLIATLALWFQTKHYGWLASAMLVATLALALRPNMIAMPVGVAIVGLCHIASTRHWQKPLAAILVPFMLVMGFESAYYHAHHETRNHDLLHKHMFGKAALVLAIHEDVGGDDRLKPFMARFGETFRADRDRHANEKCKWLLLHALYEDGAYSQIELGRLSPPPLGWAWRVFTTYPLTTAQVIAQHYLNFFCVAGVKHSRPPSTTLPSDAILFWYIDPSPKPLAKQLIGWAFITLALAFFTAKLYYGYRWGIMLLTALRRLVPWRGMAFLSHHYHPQTPSRWKPPSHQPSHRWLGWLGQLTHSWLGWLRQPPPLTPTEAPLEYLGSTCIMLAFGYNLFISIFSVSITRFLIISYPLIVLGILLMLTLIAQEILTKHKRH